MGEINRGWVSFETSSKEKILEVAILCMYSVSTKPFRWNSNKASSLIDNASRGNIGFQDFIIVIENGGLLDNLKNNNYPNQRLYVVEINSYAYVISYIETEDEIFLKTIYPSRKMTAKYLEGNHVKKT